MINYTKIKKKISPDPDGQGFLRLQTGTINAIASDGTVDLALNGTVIPNVPVLGSARFVSGQSVQVLSFLGSLLIIGGSRAESAQSVQTIGNSTGGTTTSTTFTNTLTTTGVHGVAFIAPPSGVVWVTGRAAASNSNLGSSTSLDLEVRQGATIGSGTVVRAADDSTRSIVQSAAAGNVGEHSASVLVTGLTPGAAYNACLAYLVNANTGTYTRRFIAVLPQ